jgi:hypothetical protein
MNLPTGLRLVMPLAVRKMKGQASAQGMGRHNKDDVIEMGRKDLRAISDYLGIIIIIITTQINPPYIEYTYNYFPRDETLFHGRQTHRNGLRHVRLFGPISVEHAGITLRGTNERYSIIHTAG